MQDDVSVQPLPGADVSTDQGAAPAPVTNLDSLSEFEFQGEKYTPDRLQEMFTGYRTLNQEKQGYQEKQKYWDNLSNDLKSVKSDPSLAAKFREIYPKEFHAYLEMIGAQETQQAQGIPKEFLNEFGQLKNGFNSMREQLQQLAVDKANAQLDAILPRVFEKFPLAVEDAVLARAEAFISNGGKMTDHVWERLAKESHEVVKRKTDSHYKKELQTQLEAGNKSADTGPGGAPPGKAPPKLRTFEDAQKAYMAHLKSQGIN